MPHNADKIKVLLIDDDEEDFMITEDIVTEIPGGRYELTWASSYQEGLKYILQKAHDVYLVDYRLGKEDGLRLLEAARERDIDRPFILLTGHADRQLDIEAMESGAADFLVKGQITAELLDRSIRYSIKLNRTVQSLRTSQTRLAEAQELSHIGHFDWLVADNQVVWSEEHYRIFGMEPNGKAPELNKISQYLSDDLPKLEKKLRFLIHVGDYEEAEYKIQLPNQGEKFLFSKASAKRDASGQVYRISGTTQDITQLKVQERLIAKEKEAAQTYLDMAGSIILIINKDESVREVNQEGAMVLGYAVDQIKGKNWFDHFISVQDRESVRQVFRHILLGEIEHVEYFENKILSASGEERLISWYNRLLKDDQGNAIATISSGIDITDQRKADLRLEASEKRFREIVEKLPAGAAIIQNGKISFNRAAEDMLGYQSMDFNTIDDWFTVAYQEQATAAREAYEEQKKQGFPEAVIIHFPRKDGQFRWINFRGYLFENGVAWLLNDITQTRLAEQVLKESQEKLQDYAGKLEQEVASQTAELALSQAKLIEAHKLAKIGYWEINLQGEKLTLDWSKECFQLFDISPQAIKENSFFLQFVVPEDRERVRNITIECIKQAKDLITDFRIKTIKGREKFIHMELKCLKNKEGQAEKIFSVIQDISEQKNAELKLAQSLDKERELGELKSRFVSMASHEFRTPLSAILSSADLIRRYIDKDMTEKMPKHIGRIKSSVNNLTSILNDFLSLEKLESGKVDYLPESVQIHPYIE
ncbi:MAG: PAS domain S-box protein, partial [Bacteroidota bacterium]